ncbi:transcriptional adapter ada2b [Quercus suber]|uniref:Transcriptional adapter ada2b n=1 Tax=Quercus suber TaxID=58331 RepID=A0AAW0KM43_QUESU
MSFDLKLVNDLNHQADRSFVGKRPHSSVSEGPSLVELSGYNHKRQEFDPEYDNDAEQLDERKHRKDFILERNLLYPNHFEKDLLPEERAICRRYDVFMRFHSKEEHEDLLQTVISEHRTLKRIQELKEARAAGCRTAAEADRYLEQKRKREAEESARRAKESAQVGPSSQAGPNPFMASESGGKESNSRPAVQATSSSINDLEITGLHGADLLSESEARAAGCRTAAEADRYLEQKRKREAEESARRAKESAQVGPSSQAGPNPFMASESGGKESNSRPAVQATSSSINDLEITGLHGADLLSESEKRLCSEIRLPPALYLSMQEIMSIEIINGNVSKKADAHRLFKLETSKIDRVYDMLVKKGIAQP